MAVPAAGTSTAKLAGRSWRRVAAEALISPRSNDPPKRRSGDVAAVLIGAAVFAFAANRVHSASEIEAELARFFNRLPEGWSGVFTAVLGLGALWVVASMASLGALARRPRLSLELTIAGTATWLTGRLIASTVGGRAPPSGIRIRGGTFHEFPTVRVAVATAIVVAASPYITRLARYLGWVFVAAIALAAAARGIGLPNDIVGGLALGWTAAAVVHFAFGSPAGRPSLGQIDEALREFGIPASGLRFAPAQQPGSTTLLADTDDGRVFVRAYGRDERDGQLLSKLWRFVWYEDSGPTLYLTRLQQVEHEAYSMLVARSAGAPVPEVLAAATAGPGTAMLVERLPDGVAVSDHEDLSETTLDQIWRAVLALRSARLAHGALDLDHFLQRPDGTVVITDFTHSLTMASDAQLDADIARVLAATTAAVGVDRAIAAARRHVRDNLLLESVAYLQGPLLTDHTRRDLAARQLRTNEIRKALGGAVGREPPALAQLERVQRKSIVMAVVTFLGIYVVFGQLGNFTSIRHELAGAEWGWLLVALVLAFLTNVGYALSYVGATTAHLPFGRTVVLQAAGSFTAVVTPNAVGTAAINARFLQVRGVRLSSAIASHVVNTFASGAVQTLLVVTLFPVVGSTFDLGLVPWRSLLTFVVALAAGSTVAVAVAWRLPRARRFFNERLRPALAEINTLMRSPGKITLLVTGNLLVQILSAMSLGAVCRAFGVTIPFSTLVLVNIGSSAISGLVPAPGGLGVAEATLAGALTAAGLPSASAVAVTLTNRLVSTWLPPIPGWFALRALQRADDL